MTKDFVSAVMLLLLVIDPFGNVPFANSMLADVPAARRRRIVLRECAVALAILLAFMFGGRTLLSLMHLSETSLSIAGGVILFMISIRMVFGDPDGAMGGRPRGEPFIVPLAIPLIAGPSALATVMLMATREPGRMGMWAAAVVLAMAVTTAVLAAGERLQQWLGERAMTAIERLMGFVLAALAVEMLLGGIRAFVATLQ